MEAAKSDADKSVFELRGLKNKAVLEVKFFSLLGSCLLVFFVFVSLLLLPLLLALLQLNVWRCKFLL